MTTGDPYYHRTVGLRAGGRRLELATSQELFSSHQVDRGSRLLLRVAGETMGRDLPGARVVDVGCGYGTLGLGLRAMGAGGGQLVDRDALAVLYAAENAARNALTSVATFGSLGYEDVTGAFDLAVANVPGHASASVVRHFTIGAGRVLRAGGRVGLVVVAPLADQVASALERGGAGIEARVEDRGHVVFVASISASVLEEAAGLQLYRRGEVGIDGGPAGNWSVDAGEGIPEFERLSHHTTALLRYLGDMAETLDVRSAAIWNPGQGHVAIAVRHLWPQAAQALADRDLLALRCSASNLARNGLAVPEAVSHGIAPAASGQESVDLAIDILRRSEPTTAAVARIVAARDLLRTGGAVVVAGPGTAVARAAAALTSAGIAVRRIERRRTSVLRVTR